MMYLREPLVKERPVGGHSTEDLHKSFDILPIDTKIIIEPSHLLVKILEGLGMLVQADLYIAINLRLAWGTQ